MNWKLYFAGLGLLLLLLCAGYLHLFYSYGTLSRAIQFYQKDVNSLEQFCDYRDNLSYRADAERAMQRLRDGNILVYKTE
jgi:hypothetical protein